MRKELSYYYFQVIWFQNVKTQKKQLKTSNKNIIQKGECIHTKINILLGKNKF